MTTQQLEHVDAASLCEMPLEKLMKYYEGVGDICERHPFDCLCKTCSLFMAIGDEVYKRRRAVKEPQR